MIGGKNHHSVHEIPTTLFAECLGPAFDIFGLFPNSQNTLLYLEVIYHICYRHLWNNFCYRHLCNDIFWNCYHLVMFVGLHLFFLPKHCTMVQNKSCNTNHVLQYGVRISSTNRWSVWQLLKDGKWANFRFDENFPKTWKTMINQQYLG